MKIVVSFENPPIPDRSHDYAAFDDDTYDGPGCLVGRGSTPIEAVKDLIEQMENRQ